MACRFCSIELFRFFFYPIEFDFETTDFLVKRSNVGIIGFLFDASVFEYGFCFLEELCFPSADDDGMDFELGGELADGLVLPMRGEGDFCFERCRVSDTLLAHRNKIWHSGCRKSITYSPVQFLPSTAVFQWFFAHRQMWVK